MELVVELVVGLVVGPPSFPSCHRRHRGPPPSTVLAVLVVLEVLVAPRAPARSKLQRGKVVGKRAPRGPALWRGCHWRWHPQSLAPQELRCLRCRRGRRDRRPRPGLDRRPPSRWHECRHPWGLAGEAGREARYRWLVDDHHRWPFCCGSRRRRPPGCRGRLLGGEAFSLRLVWRPLRRSHRRAAAGAGRLAPSPWLRGCRWILCSATGCFICDRRRGTGTVASDISPVGWAGSD